MDTSRQRICFHSSISRAEFGTSNCSPRLASSVAAPHVADRGEMTKCSNRSPVTATVVKLSYIGPACCCFLLILYHSYLMPPNSRAWTFFASLFYTCSKNNGHDASAKMLQMFMPTLHKPAGLDVALGADFGRTKGAIGMFDILVDRAAPLGWYAAGL